MLACETTLATSLRLRGIQPYFLMCDHALPACEWNRWGNYDPDPGEFAPPVGSPWRGLNCDHCTSSLAAVLANFPYPVARFREMIRPEDRGRLTAIVDAVPFDEYRSVVYRGVAVGDQAFASTLRAVQRGTLESTPYTRWLYRRYLLAALWVVELGERVLEHVRPDHMIVVHGVYVTHGTLCELARRKGVHVVVWDASYRRDALEFSHDVPLILALKDAPNTVWSERTLLPEQEKRIIAYLDSRRFGSQDQITYHAHAIESREQLISEFDLDLNRPIFSLYTNIMHDEAIFYSSKIFRDQLDWLFQTITYFSTRPGYQLVIRVHPSEARGMGTKQAILDEIKAHYPNLPENVKVIPPESHLSSYTLADMSQSALIFGSRIGLEIAVRGIPVIVVGDTFVGRKGFTYDPNSQEEYFALLDRGAQLPRNSLEVVKLGLKFAYHLFFRATADFPHVHARGVDMSRGLRLTFRRLSDLAPGHSASVDAICDGIMRGSDFVVD